MEPILAIAMELSFDDHPSMSFCAELHQRFKSYYQLSLSALAAEKMLDICQPGSGQRSS